MSLKIPRYTAIRMVAALWTATIAVSCGHKLRNIDSDRISEALTQVVMNMDASQTENGVMQMRLVADRMERYENGDDDSRELFPDGFNVLAYNEEGLLETQIVSDKAEHTVSGETEKWSAYGNVVITNYLEGQKIMTDTLYWDREKKIIFTDCHVRLYSPQGFMQGYGLESDERARNAHLLRVFDSYGIVSEDTTGTGYVDTVNFIGPRYRR